MKILTIGQNFPEIPRLEGVGFGAVTQVSPGITMVKHTQK